MRAVALLLGLGTTATSGLPQFLLVVAGLSCIIAGLCHVPRYREGARLERRREQLEAAIEQAEAERRAYQRLRRAVREEPHYREGVLRRITNQHPHDVLPLREWLERAARQGDGLRDGFGT